MKFLLIFSLFITTSAFAVDVDQNNVAAQLDEMVKNKVISSEEAEKAKIKMRGMSSDQWSALTEKAEKQASRMPASAEPAQIATDSKSLDGAQLDQIQNDMKMMMPERR